MICRVHPLPDVTGVFLVSGAGSDAEEARAAAGLAAAARLVVRAAAGRQTEPRVQVQPRPPERARPARPPRHPWQYCFLYSMVQTGEQAVKHLSLKDHFLTNQRIPI